jgi:hypothetical protein
MGAGMIEVTRCFPFISPLHWIIVLLLFVIVVIALRQVGGSSSPAAKKNGWKTAFIVLVLLIMAVVAAEFMGIDVVSRGKKIAKCTITTVVHTLKSCLRGESPDLEPNSGSYYYDTDPECDHYIKNNLNRHQLRQLDSVLKQEKAQGGRELNSDLVKGIGGDNVYNAYQRWRTCYELRRSSGHVVYPSER